MIQKPYANAGGPKGTDIGPVGVAGAGDIQMQPWQALGKLLNEHAAADGPGPAAAAVAHIGDFGIQRDRKSKRLNYSNDTTSRVPSGA